MADNNDEIRSESRLMAYFKKKLGNNTRTLDEQLQNPIGVVPSGNNTRLWWTVTVVVTDGSYHPMYMSEYYESEQEATKVAKLIMDRGWFEYGNTYFPMHRIVEVKVVMDQEA